MQSDAFADAVTELQRQRADLAQEIAQLTSARDSIDAQLLGMFRARDLLAPVEASTPVPVPKTRARPDVRGAVTEVLQARASGLTEPPLVMQTGLPVASVHAYLLRAVRAGELVRDGERYRLPETPAAADPLRDDAIEQAAAAAPDKDDAAALDFITRCGDMGAGPSQLNTVRISKDAVNRLVVVGKIEAMDNGRVRAVTATEAEEAAQ